jgi:conjugative transfer ATPase
MSLSSLFPWLFPPREPDLSEPPLYPPRHGFPPRAPYQPKREYKPKQWCHPYSRHGEGGPPTQRRVEDMYYQPPSFTNLLPWLDYDPEPGVFLLADGRGLGVLFELRPAGCEARPEVWLEDFRDKLQGVLCSLPEADPPWILQLFVQDEPLRGLLDRIAAYGRADARETEFATAWQAILGEHLDDIGRPEGLFADRVGGGRWRGRVRRVRATLTRFYPNPYPGGDPDHEVNDVAERFTGGLEAAGIGVRRCGGEDLWDWLVRWFNPAPPHWPGGFEEKRATGCFDYPGDRGRRAPPGELEPFGYDFSGALLGGLPVAEPHRGGVWFFDGIAHRAVALREWRRAPVLGAFTLERRLGDHVYALFDRMPEDTVLSLTVTLRPQDQVREHLLRIERASFGENAQARLAAEEARAAQTAIAQGNKLFPVQTVFCVRGRNMGGRWDPWDANEDDLFVRIRAAEALLGTAGGTPIHESDDLVGLDTYLQALPMGYDPRLDRKYLHRSRLTFSRQIADLSPLFGRSTGTGNPGIVFYNRGGEPLLFDPLADRKSNAHALVLGPPGSGKSALLNYVLMQMMAVHRPRVFIIEKGGSFSLLGQYFARLGLSVNVVTMKPGADVSLPPFAEAPKLLDTRRRRFQDPDAGHPWDLDEDPAREADDGGEDDARDLLGEMEIAARLMITGGDPREDDRLTRADRMIIRQAILAGAARAGEKGRDHALTEDVMEALKGLATGAGLNARRRERIADMADALSLFCSPGSLEAHFFNRPGHPWPEVDVTLFEMGVLAGEGYEDKLNVAFVGLMNHIHALVERCQYERRPTLVVVDEAHLITTNPLLAPFLIKIGKMWRKLGAWLWLATQNMGDFPDAAKRLLNMMEWWLCLSMPVDEVEQIARFRELTAEERALLLAAGKEPGKYTEGVLLTPALKALFRNVPPALALALAMTEQDEKAERADLMRERGCTELEAALIVAERLAAARRGG